MDYSILKPIVIGMIGGDGIGPSISARPGESSNTYCVSRWRTA